MEREEKINSGKVGSAKRLTNHNFSIYLKKSSSLNHTKTDH